MKTDKKRSFRGAVLLTVVSVMSLLIIFLTSTLALATAANNRAHKSYASSQANYTARAAIEGIRKAAESDTAFAEAIAKVGSTNTSLDVDVSMESAVAGIGKVDKALVSYVGKQQYYDESKKEWVDKDLISVSVDVTYAKETKTSTVYLLKDPPKKAVNKGNGGGLVTVGTAATGNHTNTFGGTYLGIGIGKGTRMYQGDYSADSGIAELQNVTLSEKRYLSNQNFFWGNEATIEAPLVINGNLDINTNTEVIFPTKGSGMSVWGNLTLQNNSFKVYSNTVNNNKAVEFSQQISSFKDIPYIFVDSKFSTAGDISPVIGSNDLPLNMFVGSLSLSAAPQIFADVYCQDSGVTSTINGSGAGTALYAFANSIATSGSSYLNSNMGGSIYSKGNLDLKMTKISGDVKADGFVNLENCTVYGDVVCGNNLTIKGNTKIIGNVYCKGVLNLEPSCKVFGTVYNTEQAGNEVKTLNEEYSYYPNELHFNEPYPGYAREENVWHLQEMKLGYSEYANIELECEGPVQPEWSPEGPRDKFGNLTGGSWDARYYIGSDVYLFKPYERVDRYGNATGEIVRETYSYYNPDGNPCSQGEVRGDYYTEWNNPMQSTSEQYYYYHVDAYGNYDYQCSKGEAWCDGTYYVRNNGDVVSAADEFAGITFYNINDPSQTPVTDYNAVFKQSIISASTDDNFNEIFPRQAEKAVILGIETLDGSVPTEDEQVEETKIVKTVDELEQEYNFDSNGIHEVRNGADKVAANVYDGDNDPNLTYTDSSKSEILITENCTLKGNFSKPIRIKSSGEIWVKLQGFTTNNQVIFDDLKDKADMNDEEKAKADSNDPDDFVYSGGQLNILLAGENTINGSNSRIITESYKRLLDNNVPFQIVTDTSLAYGVTEADPDGDNRMYCPAINIYSVKKEDAEGPAKLTITNNGLITAAIEAPDLTYNITNAAVINTPIDYNGTRVNTANGVDRQIGIIGILNANDISGQNNWAFLYAPRKDDGEDDTWDTADHNNTKYVITYYDGF